MVTGLLFFFAVNDGLNHIQPGFSLRRRIEAVQLREFFPTEDDVERCGILHHMLNTGRFRDRQHSRMTNHQGEQQLRYRNPRALAILMISLC